jgi:ribonuclease-3
VLWTLQPQRYKSAAALEQRLGYQFRNRTLLFEALTQRSALVGVAGMTEDVLASRPWNERLEFLGDSVLGLVISEALLNMGQVLSEGDMSRARAGIVCEANLARIARESLQLGDVIVLGGSEMATGGQAKASILADAFEALLGAVFMDAGWDEARRLIQRLFAAELLAPQAGYFEADAKTKFQELAQASRRLTPTYEVLEEAGPAHQKSFKVAAMIGADVWGQGSGSTKKEAAQAAARQALSRMTEVSS